MNEPDKEQLNPWFEILKLIVLIILTIITIVFILKGGQPFVYERF
ncbi:hypothetical protein ACFL54_03905 [Planctomycetota bacterium]